MAFISLRAVRVSCQIPQNAVAEAPLGAELPGAEALAGAEAVLGEAPLGAEALLGARLPQADSARARAVVTNGVASNPSRPVLRDVCSMRL